MAKAKFYHLSYVTEFKDSYILAKTEVMNWLRDRLNELGFDAVLGRDAVGSLSVGMPGDTYPTGARFNIASYNSANSTFSSNLNAATLMRNGLDQSCARSESWVLATWTTDGSPLKYKLDFQFHFVLGDSVFVPYSRGTLVAGSGFFKIYKLSPDLPDDYMGFGNVYGKWLCSSNAATPAQIPTITFPTNFHTPCYDANSKSVAIIKGLNYGSSAIMGYRSPNIGGYYSSYIGGLIGVPITLSDGTVLVNVSNKHYLELDPDEPNVYITGGMA
ncbi:MAG: hypothetical protein LBR64_10780 [Dysgonamonadaceae bacterium]|jgi:hypothetical protein|nr:hypothetical protein [Dysgonamonadaceae bacterium]